MTFGVGGLTTLNIVPAAFTSAYGSSHVPGWFLFLRARPFHIHQHTMDDMPGM
jgi:hypothetical protein